MNLPKNEMKNMLSEYMDKGFLENIIALFRSDTMLFEFIPGLLSDEKMKVRLGAAALVEELVREYADRLKTVIPELTVLLRHENPNVRGDTAYVLGIIKDPAAVSALSSSLLDDNQGVRESAQDALDRIRVYTALPENP